MSIRARIRSYWKGVSQSDQLSTEMDDEMRFHVEMEAKRLRARGLSEPEAQRQAIIAFGGKERYKEEGRESRGFPALGIFCSDLRYAARGIRGNAMFSLTLVGTLAIGIGTATIMFSIFDALLFRPLPVRNPEQVVDVLPTSESGGSQQHMAWSDAQVWKDQSGVFDGLMGTIRTNVLYTGGPEPVTLPALGVESNFNELLGVSPYLGRPFSESDAEVGALPVVIVDFEFWKGALGGDPNAVGRSIELEGARYEVIGVMPAKFRFPFYSTTAVWLPIHRDGSFLGDTSPDRLAVVGRIATTSLAAAQSRADGVASALDGATPNADGWRISLKSAGEARSTGFGYGQGAWILGGSVLLLVLASAANAAGLLLMRSWSRTRELGLRVALGSSRARLVRQVVLESLLIALFAALAAAVVSALGLRLILEIVPERVIFYAPFEIALNGRAITATFLIATAIALLISVPSALRATRLGQRCAEGGLGKYAMLTPTSSRTRLTLLFVQVMLSAVLLAGASLLGNSYARLTAADPGFRIDNIAVLQMSLPPSNYPESASRVGFLEMLKERLVGLPGVETALIDQGTGSASGLMFFRGLETRDGPVDPATGREMLPSVAVNPEFFEVLPFVAVDPEFFEALDVRLVSGRRLVAEDVGSDNVVVNSHLAKIISGTGNPVGRQFRSGPDEPWRTVVGVIPDLRLTGPDERTGPAAMLLPRDPRQAPSFVSIAILTRSDARPLFNAIRSAVHDLDPELPIGDLRLAADHYMEGVALPRFLLVVLSLLSAVALAVVMIGIHGLFSYQITQRRAELGVRIAVGATRDKLYWEVGRSGIRTVLLATIAGVAAAIAGSALIRSFLYGVQPADPLTLGLVVGTLLLTAVIASIPPVVAAWRTDPARVLRAE